MSLFVDIEKRLGSFQLRIRFETEARVLGLLGASGAGKSMTLKCIAGIERPDRGKILLNGRCLFDSELGIDLPCQKRQVAYLFENYALFPHMTVLQNLRCALRDKTEGEEAIKEILSTMRLTGQEGKKPHQLSRGQQQRLALGRILLNKPEILLLDEPFSALDRHLRAQLETELQSVLRRFSKDVILVSHDPEELFRLSEAVAILRDGQIEMLGEKHRVFSRPVSRNSARLTGCSDLLELEKSPEGRVFLKGWGIELTEDPAFLHAEYAALRPESLKLAEGGADGIPCRLLEAVESPGRYRLLLAPLEEDASALHVELEKSAWEERQGTELRLCPFKEALLPLND